VTLSRIVISNRLNQLEIDFCQLSDDAIWYRAVNYQATMARIIEITLTAPEGRAGESPNDLQRGPGRSGKKSLSRFCRCEHSHDKREADIFLGN